MCDEMKINSISNDPKWLFWKIALKNPNNWEKIIELKKKDKCFECSLIQSIEWINYYAYNIIDDKVNYIYYCEPCYTKWIQKDKDNSC
jgi:hypothetical protein